MKYVRRCLGILCALFLLTVGIRMARELYRNATQVVRTTEEERKGRTYTAYGYDYVKRIVSAMPQPEIFPSVRYTNYAHPIDVLLPFYVDRIDDRIVIGIQIDANDIKESPITDAERMRIGSASYWTFKTQNDYDTLTGIRFQMASDRVKPPPAKITLYKDDALTDVLGTWEYSANTMNDSVHIYRFPSHLPHFSFYRGNRNFIIALEPIQKSDDPDVIKTLTPYGIKIDLSEYSVIHKEDNNFIAIRKTFLAEIEQKDLSDWKNFMKQLALWNK